MTMETTLERLDYKLLKLKSKIRPNSFALQVTTEFFDAPIVRCSFVLVRNVVEKGGA